MNKFDNNAIYFGTLIIIENQHEKIYKENVCLIYDSKTDHFFSLNETLNEFMDLNLNKNLTEVEKNSIKNKIEKYKYNYKKTTEDGKIYVDLNSLKKIENGEKNENNGSTRRK